MTRPRAGGVRLRPIPPLMLLLLFLAAASRNRSFAGAGRPLPLLLLLLLRLWPAAAGRAATAGPYARMEPSAGQQRAAAAERRSRPALALPLPNGRSKPSALFFCSEAREGRTRPPEAAAGRRPDCKGRRGYSVSEGPAWVKRTAKTSLFRRRRSRFAWFQ